MDRCISRDEIRAAVWDCGENKSPGPDGYTFEFFRRYWNFIGPDFCSAVEGFFESGIFPKGCNASFIALIPKVTDAKFVTDFRPISLIGCVYKINETTNISHLFYADDAVFIGEWSDSNMENIVKILKCFFLASGLKINIQKSQVLGVGIPRTRIIQAASKDCCRLCISFSDIRCDGGDRMVSINLLGLTRFRKLRSRLSSGRSNVFDGGRLTLSKSVLWSRPFRNERFIGSLGIKVLASKKKWWLGVSVSMIECALLLKETDKESTVASKLSLVSIDVSFRRSVRDGVERQQWTELTSILDSVILSPSMDRWFCDLNGEAMLVFRKICRWWDLDWQDRMSWFSSIRLSSRIKLMLEGVFYVAWWHLWVYRNQLIFAETSPRRSVIFDDIVCMGCRKFGMDYPKSVFVAVAIEKQKGGFLL
ncbi:hypothetical protein Tco_1227514 [Tanacetum coccineum]